MTYTICPKVAAAALAIGADPYPRRHPIYGMVRTVRVAIPGGIVGMIVPDGAHGDASAAIVAAVLAARGGAP